MQQCRRLEFSTIFVLSFDPNENIDVHGLKIQGSGYLNFLSKSLGLRLSGKIARWGSPISGFITFLLTSVLKFPWGGPALG